MPFWPPDRGPARPAPVASGTGPRPPAETVQAFTETLGAEHRGTVVAVEGHHLDCDVDPPV
ncbi:hypothetical protein [Actinomadura macra]|uniref:hypothetical protein n=1 Tax=Actinomadura macra TaxID=46164 RepID=UPI000830955E|nr:hypothetical protein [Actinomadura macra]